MAKKRMGGQLQRAVGGRGENIFELAITVYSLTHNPLFEPAFFTDRWPAIDYVVELRGVRGLTPFFFVQVKSTADPIEKNRIMIKLPPEKKKTLAALPGPTYLIGVQEPTRRTFIRAILDPDPPGVYEIPKSNELTPKRLQVLYDEVIQLWMTQTRKPQSSNFP